MLDISRRELYALVLAHGVLASGGTDFPEADNDCRDFSQTMFRLADAMILNK